MSLQPGDTLLNGQYCILGLLGRGGFGFVYRAHDTLLDRDVAVKELIPALVGDPAWVKRFLVEARATLDLHDDHIVTTHTLFAEAGNHYLVMEYMPGGSLEQRLQWGAPPPLEEVLRTARDICLGLAYAHRRGVIHCDLKPGNILFAADGTAKVGDFGVAHVSGGALARTWATSAGFAAGTVAYMSPEQADGERCDPRIDLYALGAVLYRMLTGRGYLDFDQRDTPGASADNVIRIRQQLPAAPGALRPEVPVWLDALVLQLLAKRADVRPGSAEEVLARLQREAAQVVFPVDGPVAVAARDLARAAAAAGSPGGPATVKRVAPPLPARSAPGGAVRESRPGRAWLVAIALLALLGFAAVLSLSRRWDGEDGLAASPRAEAEAPRPPTAVPKATLAPAPTRAPEPTPLPTRRPQPTPLPTMEPQPTPVPTRTAVTMATDAPSPMPTRTPVPTFAAVPVGATATRKPATATRRPPAPTSTPEPVRCPHPGAQIAFPGMDREISGYAPFLGTADIPRFAYYKMEYHPDGVQVWSLLYKNSVRVSGGPLMTWVTSTVPAGVYWVRLVVVDESGNYVEPCEVRVRIVR